MCAQFFRLPFCFVLFYFLADFSTLRHPFLLPASISENFLVSRRISGGNMASVSYHIANLLEKMTSADKDFRFMATNDLMSELQKDSIKLDDDSERKVVRMLLKLLEDKNGEVQNLAVKCLGPLVNKVKDTQVRKMKFL